MSGYTIGISCTLLVICLHSWANIFDNYFSAKIFKKLTTLIFLSSFVNLFFLPFVFFTGRPEMLNLASFGVVLLIALCNVAYQYPYYWSLRTAETSVVVSLFSLGKIATPLFAFFIVGEHLQKVQYLGFFTIILSSVLLTIDFKKIRLNKECIYMLIVSVLLTIQLVLYKYLFQQSVKWSSSVIWVAIVDMAIVTLFMVHPENFKDLKSLTELSKKQIGLFVLNQCFTWTGDIIGVYAVYFIPVSLFEGVESTQPVFVLIFALLFIKKIPRLFNEYVGKDKIAKKIVLFILMVIGTLLIILPTITTVA